MHAIALRDVLNTMEARDPNTEELIPFSLKCVTYNHQQKTGGEILSIDKAVICDDGKRSPASPKNSAQLILNEVQQMGHKKRNPNHYDNFTRNIKLLPSGNNRKIHPLLIIEFNGQKVF